MFPTTPERETPMTLFIVLAILLPWSLYRQMHEHPVTREGLIKLPLIFAAIGLLGWTAQDNPTDAAAVGYMALSLGLSVGLGIWRGAVIPDLAQRGRRLDEQGQPAHHPLWILLIAAKFAMGTIASITGWFPASGTSEVFLFLGISFAAQNLVVARRTIARDTGVRAPALSR